MRKAMLLHQLRHSNAQREVGTLVEACRSGRVGRRLTRPLRLVLVYSMLGLRGWLGLGFPRALASTLG